jgi:hypothetical protein
VNGEPVDVVVSCEYADDFRRQEIVVHVTNEGVIFDFIGDGEIVATLGMTFDEWYLMSRQRAGQS